MKGAPRSGRSEGVGSSVLGTALLLQHSIADILILLDSWVSSENPVYTQTPNRLQTSIPPPAPFPVVGTAPGTALQSPPHPHQLACSLFVGVTTNEPQTQVLLRLAGPSPPGHTQPCPSPALVIPPRTSLPVPTVTVWSVSRRHCQYPTQIRAPHAGRCFSRTPV